MASIDRDNNAKIRVFDFNAPKESTLLYLESPLRTQTGDLLACEVINEVKQILRRDQAKSNEFKIDSEEGKAWNFRCNDADASKLVSFLRRKNVDVERVKSEPIFGKGDSSAQGSTGIRPAVTRVTPPRNASLDEHISSLGRRPYTSRPNGSSPAAAIPGVISKPILTRDYLNRIKKQKTAEKKPAETPDIFASSFDYTEPRRPSDLANAGAGVSNFAVDSAWQNPASGEQNSASAVASGNGSPNGSALSGGVTGGGYTGNGSNSSAYGSVPSNGSPRARRMDASHDDLVIIESSGSAVSSGPAAGTDGPRGGSARLINLLSSEATSESRPNSNESNVSAYTLDSESIDSQGSPRRSRRLKRNSAKDPSPPPEILISPTPEFIAQLQSDGYKAIKFPFANGRTTTLSINEIARFQDNVFLDDTLISFFFKLYQQITGTSETTHVFSTFFYTGMEKGDDINKWTSKVNLKNKKLVIIPIHRSSHWSAVVITGLDTYLDENDESGKPPRMIWFDSLGTVAATGKEIFKVCGSIINKILESKGIATLVPRSFPRINTVVPVQSNLSDCGLFTIEFMRVLMMNIPRFLEVVDKTVPTRSKLRLRDISKEPLAGRKEFLSMLYVMGQEWYERDKPAAELVEDDSDIEMLA